MKIVLKAILLALLLFLASCSGISPESDAPDNAPPSAGLTALIAELPALDSLDSGSSRRISDETDRIAGYSIENTMSVNVEHELTPDSAVLHSTAGELSWVIYRYSPEHFASDVPFIVPYSVVVGTANEEPFWIAVADYGRDAWSIYPEELAATPGDEEVSVDITLDYNGADAEGVFSFAIIAYNGAEPQVVYLDLAYPDAAPPDQPVDYHQFIYARDGTALATDIYLPYAESSPAIPDPPYPVLLMCTPYDKAGIPSWIVPTVTQLNIAVMVQYFRGRLDDSGAWPDSEGTETLFRDHCGPLHYDAIDTVEWIEQRSWYNGELILSGASATGGWIYQAASQLGDRVAAIYPQLCAGDMGEWAIRTNGCLRRSNLEGWIEGNDYPLELIDQVESNLENETFWNTIDFDQYADGADCPGYHETGWYDVNVDATIASWRALTENGGPAAAGNQWLIIGPWTHDAPRSRVAGEITFPNDGSLHDPAVLPAGWDGTQWILDTIGRYPFAFAEPDNRVLVYLVGNPGYDYGYNNQWVELPSWPPSSSESVKYLNYSYSTAWLSNVLREAGNVVFTTNPSFPIPTLGGANLPFPGVIEAGPMDQTPVLDREGVLDFSDDGFAARRIFIGVPRLILYVSTDSMDTDIIIKLAHYDSLSSKYLICDTSIRLSNYLSEHSLGPVVPDTIYELDIELGNIAQSFDIGDEVHVVIQGTNYPRFDINPGNGDPIYNGINGEEQTTTIYFGESHPSRLILPMWEP